MCLIIVCICCVYVRCLLWPSVVFLAAAPARARTLKKEVFAWRVCRISLFGLFRARTENTENEMKNSTESSPTKQRNMHATINTKRAENKQFWSQNGTQKRPRSLSEAACAPKKQTKARNRKLTGPKEAPRAPGSKKKEPRGG